MARELPPPVPGGAPRRRAVRPPVSEVAAEFDDELDEQPAAPAAPMWPLAIGIAAFGAFARQLLGGSFELDARQLGGAIGWMLGPLLVAWFVSQFWKARHAPVVVVGLMVAVALTGFGKTGVATDETRAVYAAELGHELDAWRRDARAWLDQGVGSWRRLGDRAAMERHVQSGGELHDHTRLLRRELDLGTRFRKRLAEAAGGDDHVDEAWRVVREEPGHVRAREQLARLQELIGLQLRLCAEVRQLEGRYLVVGDGELTPSADVDPGLRDRLRALQQQVRAQLVEVRAMLSPR